MSVNYGINTLTKYTQTITSTVNT